MSSKNYLKEIGSENLNALLAGYREYLLNTDRGRSARIYLGDVQGFIKWFIDRQEKFNPQLVTPMDLVDFRNYLQKQPGRMGGYMAPVTINRKIVSLRIFFGWLYREKITLDNPVADIKPVGQPVVPEAHWLSRNEQNDLVRAVKKAQNTRDYTIIALLLHTGLRISELCSLERADIEITPRGGQVCVRGGKGNKYRAVPLNRTIRKILQEWLKFNPEGPLFPNRYRRAISTRGLFKLIEKYAYMARIDNKLSPHTLRHCFGKGLVDRGEPIEKVAMLMGHSSVNVTMRYVVPSQEDLQRSVEQLAWE